MLLSESKVDFEQIRSGGPGGQHANRRATAVRLRTHLDDLPLNDEQKKIIREHLPARFLTKSGEIIVENAESRSSEQNRRNALEVANEELKEALERGRQARRREHRRQRVSNSGGGGGGGERDIKEEKKRRRRAETTDDLLAQAYREDPDLMD